MIRKLMLTSMLGLLALPLFAQDNINKMKVFLTDGTQIVYALNEEPIISFSEDSLIVTVGGNVYNHPLLNLQRYEILAVNISGVAETDADNVDVKRNGDVFEIQNTMPGAEIAIYAVGGETMCSARADADGRAVVSIEHLDSGIYILNVNGTATKISKQ